MFTFLELPFLTFFWTSCRPFSSFWSVFHHRPMRWHVCVLTKPLMGGEILGGGGHCAMLVWTIESKALRWRSLSMVVVAVVKRMAAATHHMPAHDDECHM